MLIHTDSEQFRTDTTPTDAALFVCSVGINTVGRSGAVKSDLTILRPQGRQDFHVLYPIKGHCTVLLESKQYTLSVGDFLIYYPRQAQQYSFAAAEDNACYWVHFKGHAAESLLSSLSLEAGLYHGADGEDVGGAFSALLREFSLKRTHHATYCAALLTALLCCLARTQSSAESAVSELHRREIHDVAAQISQFPELADSADTYAARLGVSVDRFSHLFKDAMQQPFHRYVQTAKLSAARRLLRESDMPISAISDVLGYNDPLYFSRLFRREVGISPREYRRKRQ